MSKAELKIADLWGAYFSAMVKGDIAGMIRAATRIEALGVPVRIRKQTQSKLAQVL